MHTNLSPKRYIINYWLIHLVHSFYIYYLSKTMLDDNEIKILDEIISDRQKFLNELFNKGKEDLLSDKYSL